MRQAVRASGAMPRGAWDGEGDYFLEAFFLVFLVVFFAVFFAFLATFLAMGTVSFKSTWREPRNAQCVIAMRR